MANIKDLVAKAKNSRLGQAIGRVTQRTGPTQGQQQVINTIGQGLRGVGSVAKGYASNLYQDSQKIAKPLNQGLYAIPEYFRVKQDRQTDLLLQQISKNRGNAQKADYYGNSAANRFGNYDKAQVQTQRALPSSLLRGALYGGSALAAPAVQVSGNLLGGVIGGASAKFSGQNVAEGIGRGASDSLKYAGLNKFTSPVIGRIAGQSKSALGRAAIQGLGNVGEGLGFNKFVEGRNSSVGEIAQDFLLGAGVEAISGFKSKDISVDKQGFLRNKMGQWFDPQNGRFVKATGKAAESIKQAQTKFIDAAGGGGWRPGEGVLVPKSDGTGLMISERAASRLRGQEGFVKLGEDGVSEFQSPYKRGDISKLQKELDEMLGTESFNSTGKWNANLPARETALKQLEFYANTGDQQAVKYLDRATKLLGELDSAQNSRLGGQSPEVVLDQSQGKLNTQGSPLDPSAPIAKGKILTTQARTKQIAAGQTPEIAPSQLSVSGLLNQQEIGKQAPMVDTGLGTTESVSSVGGVESFGKVRGKQRLQQSQYRTPQEELQLLKQPSQQLSGKGLETSDDIIQQARKEIGTLKDSDKKSLKQVADELYTQWVDRFHPIVKASEVAAKQGKIKGFEVRPEFDPKYLVRRLTGAGGIADYRFNKEFKPILGEMESLGIDKADMDVYLKARRDLGLSERGITGSNAGTAQTRIEALKGKYGDNLDVISQKIYEYQNKGFQELIDAGFLSPDKAALIRQQNPDYVPFERVMDEMDNYLGIPSPKTQQGTSPIAKIKGSEKQIYSPIESVIANTFKQRAAIEKNRVAQSIVGLQQVAPELGFQPAAKSGPDTITVWNNGQKEYWKVGPEISEAAKGLNEESMNTLLKVFSAPANLLRSGATGRNPEFVFANLFKDQLDAGTASKYGYIPFIDYASGLRSMLANDDIYQKFQQSGAKIDLGDIRGRQSIKESFDEKTAKKGLFSWLGKGLDTLGKYSEEPTRVGLFKKAYQKTGNELKAAMESRDATVDFARMGSKMKVANSIIPFLNVQVQGFDKLVRAVKNNPGKVAFTMGTYAVLPQVTTTAYNMLFHPEEYAEIPQFEKDSNFILISGRNEDGTVNYISIPKGNVVPMVSNPIQSFMEFTSGQSKQSFAEFATQFLSSSLPVLGDGSSIQEVGVKTIGGLTPQLFKPMAENLLNKSFFKYDPKKEQTKAIVPDYMNKLPAGDRAYEWTPAAYKAAGKILNVSPLQIQNLMEGHLAGFAKVPVRIVDNLNSLSQGKEVGPNEQVIMRRFFKQTYPSSGSTTSIKNETKAKILTQANASTGAGIGMDQAALVYKDAISKINKYKENKAKAEGGLVDKTVEAYQAEVDEALAIKRKLEKQYGSKALLSASYLEGIDETPATSRYARAIQEDKVWDKLNSVDNSESLNDYQKAEISGVLLQKLGMREQDYEYYKVAKNDNNEKTLYVLDQYDAIQDEEGFRKFLVDGRKPVNGKYITSDGVIDNLVNDGLISKDFGKSLKKIDYDAQGNLKVKTSGGGKGGSKKIKAARLKSANSYFANLKKISIKSPKLKIRRGKKINTKALTFSGK